MTKRNDATVDVCNSWHHLPPHEVISKVSVILSGKYIYNPLATRTRARYYASVHFHIIMIEIICTLLLWKALHLMVKL